MNRILASSVGLTTTILLVSACGGAGQPKTDYSRAAATESPTSTETATSPGSSPTGSESMMPTGSASPTESYPGASPTGTESGMVPLPTPEHAKVRAADSKFGKILVGEQDRTLYMFDKDKDNISNCYDTCAVTWPPLLTRGKPEAGSGVKESLLGTTARKHGDKQVTYNKHPLYYYSGDKKAGDVNGQGKTDSGGKWYVVNPDGKKVE